MVSMGFCSPEEGEAVTGVMDARCFHPSRAELLPLAPARPLGLRRPLPVSCLPSSAFCMSIWVRVQRMPPRKEAPSTSMKPSVLNCVDS